jgi:hypothetical protein
VFLFFSIQRKKNVRARIADHISKFNFNHLFIKKNVASGVADFNEKDAHFQRSIIMKKTKREQRLVFSSKNTTKSEHET